MNPTLFLRLITGAHCTELNIIRHGKDHVDSSRVELMSTLRFGFFGPRPDSRPAARRTLRPFA
jgi:hypothetical protein